MNIIKRTWNRVKSALGVAINRVMLIASWMCDMSDKSVFLPDGTVNKDAWLKRHRPLSNAGAMANRNALGCYGGTAPKSSLLTPFIYVPEADAFDLSRFNPIFWVDRRLLGEWNNEVGRIDIAIIGNECEQRRADRKAQSPWFNNVNGISGLYDEKALPIWRALARKLIETLRAPSEGFPNGVDYLIEPINESNDIRCLDAVRAILEEVKAAGYPAEKLATIGAQMVQSEFQGYHLPWPDQYKDPSKFTAVEYIQRIVDELWGAKARNRVPVPVHGVLNPAESKDPRRSFGEKWTQMFEWWIERLGNSVLLFISTDGADKTEGTYNKRPLGSRVAASMKKALEEGRRNILVNGLPKFRIEVFQHGGTPEAFAADVSLVADAIEEMGYPLANRGKFPEPPSQPEPPPPPVDPPELPPVVPPVAPAEPAVTRSVWYWLIPKVDRHIPFLHINFRRWWIAAGQEAPMIAIKRSRLWYLIPATVVVVGFLAWLFPWHVGAALLGSGVALLVRHLGIKLV